MKSRWLKGILFAAGVATVALWASSGFAQTLDEVLTNMSAKGETIKDFQVSAKVTKFDSVFEEKTTMRLEVWYKKPDWTRVDTYKTVGGREVQTNLVIIGPDFVFRATPENHTAVRQKIPADQMKRARENRNDPLTFFSRKPDDLKKDFDVQLLPSTVPNTVKLTLKPKKEGFEYRSIELVVDKATWLPTSVRTIGGGEKDDWALYEFTRIVLNMGIPDAFFVEPPGYQVKEETNPPPPPTAPKKQ